MPSLPHWLDPFSPDFRRELLAQLDAGGEHRVACLDADGTLWNEDIGEAMFRWLAAGSLLPPLGPARDPFAIYAEYEERVRRNRADGFSWAVQCMAGLAESDLRRWSWQMAVAWPSYRPAMLGLVAGLTRAGYEVWIVSASNAWIIEATASIVGVHQSHVLGIRTEVEGGRLTDRLIPPITCNAGKVEALRQHRGVVRPDIAVGDSLGDLELLESARLPLVVNTRDNIGAPLVKLAAERGWATHLF